MAKALLEQVDAQARSHGCAAVRHVSVRVGELSGVEPEALRSAYERLREHTCCAQAELEVEPVPALWACPRCERPIHAGEPLACPDCGVAARLAQGDELWVERISLSPR